MDKSPEAFRTISEVSEVLETPAHVLRFWETRFPQIRPVKRAGGRRYYRPSDVALLSGIKRLLHEEGLTIRGVQKILREQGVRHVAGLTDDTSPEEQALDAAMVGRHDEEPALPPSEAADATAAALQAALEDVPQTNIIAFPTEVPVTLPDPRQSSFPGFEPPPELDESMLEDLAADGQDLAGLPVLGDVGEEVAAGDDLEADHVAAELDEALADGSLSEEPERASDSPASALDEASAQDDPAAAAPVAEDGATELHLESQPDEPTALSAEAEAENADEAPPALAAEEPQPEQTPDAPPESAAAFEDPVPQEPVAEQVPEPAVTPQPPQAAPERAADSATLSARLRALPRGSLAARRADLSDLSARIAALRSRLGGPSQGA